MTTSRRIVVGAAVLAALSTMAAPARGQQLTTGTLSGRVRDAQGGAIPGATVILTSETRDLAGAPVVTDERGDFLVPNLAPDTYRLEVTLEGFRTLRRTGITVSGGDRLALGMLTLEVGALAETVTVTAEVPIIQAQSGERSFTVPTKLVESLPIGNRSFTMLTALAPGVTAALGGNVNAGIQPQRIGGGGQPVIMMDGVSTMDVAANRPAIQMNVESIGEVKIVTSSYQAEYGRSGGVQVQAVTKSGTNQFHGSLYDIERNSAWNANSKVNMLNGDPKPTVRERDWGYSIGGPVGKPGGANRLFFFYAHEYAPRTIGGDVVRYRVPTALERQGDFSQSIDNNGNLYSLIRDAASGLPCTAANTSGCFRDGGVLGRVPSSRLYQPSLNILRMYPLPNVNVPGAAYNYESARPKETHLAWQPAVRLDYNITQTLRAGFKYSAWMQQSKPVLGNIPGFDDSLLSRPKIDTWAATGNYAMSPTTFLEVTYGRTRQPQSGCPLATQGTAPIICRSAIPTSDAVLNAGLESLPRIFPDALVFDSRYLAYRLLSQVDTPLFQNGRALVPPTFVWGSRVANPPPNIPFPGTGGLNATYSDDLLLSLTKVVGRHTLKTGFFYAHAVKYQAQAAGTVGTLGAARGALSFANNPNNPLDSTFGFANAALGVFTSYQQLSAWAEGQNSFRNIEGYVQDTWRMSDRLTLDYGLRLVHQQPQHDDLMQGSNFLADRWEASQAPVLYVAGCANGVYPCSGNNRQAMNPLTGQLLGPGSAASIGAVVPNTGNAVNGLIPVGQGIDKYGVTSPKLGLAPRVGFAYDVTGRQTFVVRGGGGIFYSRGFGQFLVSNPPATSDVTVQFGTLPALASAVAAVPKVGPQLFGWQYDSPYPTSAQWSTGVQMMLPFSTGLDIAYIGHRAWNEIMTANIGAIDIGTAFRPEYRDRTLASSATPGASAVTDAEMRPFRGYGAINMTTNDGWRTYHGLQLSINRRYSGGLQFGFNDTISLYDQALCTSGGCPVEGLYQPRYQHNPDGSFSFRADQPEGEKLFTNTQPIRHHFKGSFVWDLPDLAAASGSRRALGWIVNDWQLAGVWTASTGQDYRIAYTYQNGGASVNLTGSPDYTARVRIVGDAGSGCSDDPLRQFNTSAFQGPIAPSLGLESGNGYLRGCLQSVLDLSVARIFRLGGGRTLQVRADIFNAPNQAIITGRNTTVALPNPNDPVTITNLPFDTSGNMIPARARPNGAGFGVANNYQAPRTVQVHLRFGF